MTQLAFPYIRAHWRYSPCPSIASIATMYRCIQCNQYRPQGAFSCNQLKIEKRPWPRCKDCTQGVTARAQAKAARAAARIKAEQDDREREERQKRYEEVPPPNTIATITTTCAQMT